MNPNDYNQSPTEPPQSTAVGASEYLDQIAAKPKSNKFLDKKMLIIIGGLLAVILIVVIVVASSSSNKPAADASFVFTKAKAQYDNAAAIIEYGVSNLSSGPTARNNAIASLVVGTHNYELSTKVGKAKLEKSQAAALRDPKAAQNTLKSAKESGRLDSEFKTTAGLFLQDIIDTLSTIQTLETTKINKDLALEYIEELQTLKTRIED
jgi:hypothetical protein